jgi:hypothetical protein
MLYRAFAKLPSARTSLFACRAFAEAPAAMPGGLNRLLINNLED